MTILKQFQEFEDQHPISHEMMIDRLFEKNFSGSTGKRLVTAKRKVSQIINATFSLSARSGFTHMTMRDLQKACDISLGGIYNFFDKKEAIASAITNELNYLSQELVYSYKEKPYTRYEQLEYSVRTFMYVTSTLSKWYRFVFMEANSLPLDERIMAYQIEKHFQTSLDDIYGTKMYPSTHILVSMQDWHLKYWKYKTVDIEVFTDNLVKLAFSAMRDVESDKQHKS